SRSAGRDESCRSSSTDGRLPSSQAFFCRSRASSSMSWGTLFILVLVEAKLRHDAIEGTCQLLAQGDIGAAQLIGKLLPAPPQGPLFGEIAFVVVEPVANLFQDLLGRRLLARVRRLRQRGVSVVGQVGIAANIAALGPQAIGLIAQLVARDRGQQ